MRKLYTEKEYSDKAVQANAEGKKLVKVQEKMDVPFEAYEYEKKTITVDDYDEETGEVIGHHTAEVDDLEKPIMTDEIDPETGETIRVQKHHTETRKEWVERLEIVDGDNIGVLKSQLETIDKKSIRSLRAVVSGTATDDDRDYLASLEEQARNIRDGLAYGM